MLANRSLGTPFSNLKVSILFLVMQPDIASEKAPPMTELVCVTTWHFQREIRVPQDDVNLIISDEQPIAAYATFRDYSIFNKKRLIARDVQGLRGGKEVEVYLLRYSSINIWSSKSAGSMLDFTGELELWTSAGNININVGRQVDVRRLDMLIASCVVGS